MTHSSGAARSVVLAKIAAKVSAGKSERERSIAVEQRLSGQPRHVVLSRVTDAALDPVGLLRGFLEGQSATVLEVPGRADVPEAIAGYLRDNNLPARLRSGADPYLAALPWDRGSQLQRLHGRAESADEVGLSKALAAVAETGTMVLTSGADNPVTLTFMPETSIIVVGRSEVVGSYEDAWEMLRARNGRAVMPRTVNFVSGPSRSADIGGKLTIGAHGPRRLCVVVVGDD
jgi:L-lactate dehydrogenase complex protein LldG